MSEQLTPGLSAENNQDVTVPDGFVDIPGVGLMKVDDLPGAMLRQDDYTRKTQELSTQRAEFERDREELEVAAALAKSLESDPASTVRALIEEFDLVEELGLTPQEAKQVVEAAEAAATQSPGLPKEVLERLQKVDAFIEDTEAQQYQAAIQTEVAEVQEEFKSKFGIDIDTVELIHYAVQNGIPDLRVAAKGLTWDMQHDRGRKEGLAAIEARENATVETTSHGSGVADEEFDSIESAFEAAKRGLFGRLRG